MDLLLDVKHQVAICDQTVWLILWRYDDFKSYASSRAGRLEFIHLFTVVSVNKRSSEWTLFGLLHRIDGPAVIVDGDQFWYQNGVLHRDGDLPAVIEDDSQIWYQRGKKHRDNDLPANITFIDECQGWRYDGNMSDIIRRSEYRTWYWNGQIHRVGGPAITRTDIYQNSQIHHINTDSDFTLIDGVGFQSWRQNGLLHRDDGPALIDGDRQVWYRNGYRHRDDGPALIDGDYQKWYQNGKRIP